MSRRNAPEKFFSAVRGCPRSCARIARWFPGQTLPVPGHGGGGMLGSAHGCGFCGFLGAVTNQGALLL